MRLAVPFLFLGLPLLPQTEDPVIRVDVDLRQVDFVVTDAKGQHVNDLRPEDFLLLEDGKPQKLTNFSWIEVTPPPTGARLKALQERPTLWEKYTGVVSFKKTPGNDILAAPVANPHKEEIRRTIVFVINDTSVPVMDRVRKFIDEQVAPGDMISVRSTRRSVVPGPGGTATIRDSMGIFQEFTNDKRQLDAATERVPRTCDFLNQCVTDVPGALIAAIQSLGNVPGRKAVVFVGGYRGPVNNVVNMANRAGVVINVLNPVEEGFPGAEPAVDLAKYTGGRWLLTEPGFAMTADLNEVMEDLSGYYLLGYHPASQDTDRAPGKTARPKIEMKVLREGLIVHARNGYIGAPDLVTKTTPPKAGREEALTDAMFSAFTADGIRVHLDPLFFASPLDPKTGKRHPIVRAVLDIDGRDLTYTELEDGGRKMVLDVALAVFNVDGTQAGAKNQTFTVIVPREKVAKFATFAKLSPQYHVDIPLSKPGPYQVRTAVRDGASREIGSSYAFLEIPDFNQRKISLSSLMLSLPAGTASVPSLRPEWNEFAPGNSVQFQSEVFGLRTPGKPPVPPDVDAEVRLYRGGGPVLDIPASAARIANNGNQSFLSGSVQIPNDLPAGNYAMEVIAYDRLAPPKAQTAIQWIDLTVLRPEIAR